MLWTKDEKKRRIGKIPGVAKVILEIRQALCHAQIGFILELKDFETRQFGVKSPHQVTLAPSGTHGSLKLMSDSDSKWLKA